MAKKQTPFQRLSDAAVSGDVESLKRAIDDGANPKHKNSICLTWAAGRGHLACVKILIPLSDATRQDSCALREALRFDHLDCDELLFPVSSVYNAKRKLELDRQTDSLLRLNALIEKEKLCQKHLSENPERRKQKTV